MVVVGSGAGGGTVAQALAPLVRGGLRVAVFDKGPRFRDEEFTGRELEMASALYEDGGGFLTADGTLTLALGSAYGGSTVVYTGTSLLAPERVIRAWGVPGLDHADVIARSRRYELENNVHLLPDGEINDNNRLFIEISTADRKRSSKGARALMHPPFFTAVTSGTSVASITVYIHSVPVCARTSRPRTEPISPASRHRGPTTPPDAAATSTKAPGICIAGATTVTRKIPSRPSPPVRP